MKNIVLVFILVVSTLVQNAVAQISFRDASTRLPKSGVFYSWMQKGACDMNNDFRDDIVRSTTTGDFFLLKQPRLPDTLFTEVSIGKILPASPLSIILGDVNNDDYPDILTGGDKTGVKILTSNSSTTFSSTKLEGSDTIFTQASAMADINGDGLLDLFVCHDDAVSGIWKNNGTTFTKNDFGIHLKTIPTSDNSGNYGIVFTDFDNDGDQDFYISKCRAGVEDPTDPRRINQLFVNDGTNHYTENAAAYNLKDDNQSWVTEFQDIDNDGDMDAFIANHHSPSRLLENDGSGHFTDITVGSGLETLPDGILQALMRDFDNDGYVDLIIAGINGGRVMKNNGNKTFTSQNLQLIEPITGKTLRSFVTADFNSDGFIDLYTSYYFGSAEPDRLWLNNKNANHYLPIYLMGYKGNRNAIGSRITIEAGGKKYIREIRSGESYGISNSLCQIVGLGSNTTITKLTIKWPSGKIQDYNNVKIDTPIYIIEGN